MALSTAPYVAFSDDDSWWAPGALTRAVEILDADPRLAVVAARVLVGPGRRLDPVSAQMAASPVPPRSPAGPSVLGFMACGAVVRRRAFLAAGGFALRYGIGGEEELLAVDLRAGGWDLAYCEEVIACHFPVSSPDRANRRRGQIRNLLWTAWLRWPAGPALRRTAHVVLTDRTAPARHGVGDALAQLRWVLTNRRPVAGALADDLRLLAGLS